MYIIIVNIYRFFDFYKLSQGENRFFDGLFINDNYIMQRKAQSKKDIES